MNYTDTADEGDDYLCSINYQMYNEEYYVLSVIYTQDAMEVTEPAVAEMLTKDNDQVSQFVAYSFPKLI